MGARRLDGRAEDGDEVEAVHVDAGAVEEAEDGRGGAGGSGQNDGTSRAAVDADVVAILKGEVRKVEAG